MPGAATLSPPLSADDHVLGPAGAPLELVMYGDFQCPYCAAAQGMVQRVRDRLGDRLRFGFRHYPLEIHPDAELAAQASEAAAAQGAFWPMHDQLYAARGHLAPADLVNHAAELGLDAARVEAELRDGVHAERVRRDADGARAAGLAATPAFYANGVLHPGAFDARSLITSLGG
jgi:NhaA family Na+:H+ antiporter